MCCDFAIVSDFVLFFAICSLFFIISTFLFSGQCHVQSFDAAKLDENQKAFSSVWHTKHRPHSSRCSKRSDIPLLQLARLCIFRIPRIVQVYQCKLEVNQTMWSYAKSDSHGFAAASLAKRGSSYANVSFWFISANLK